MDIHSFESGTEWQAFFKPGTRVTALPGWKHPRLLIPDMHKGPWWLWHKAGLYPATKASAQVYKLIQQMRVSAHLSDWHQVGASQAWPFGAFLQDVLPSAAYGVVLYAHHRSSPIEKIKVQVWSERDEILGYVKYSDKPMAMWRLQWEHEILSALPAGIGPKALKVGEFQNGLALLVSPFVGREVKNTTWPGSEVVAFNQHLWIGASHPIHEHPKVKDWVERSQRAGISFELWLAELESRTWPVAIQHGDFAPWNLLHIAGTGMRAIDWEFASMAGFPYIDLTYWILQMANLVHQWTPEKALDDASHFLTSKMALQPDEARAIVKLTALDAYLLTSEIGRDANWPVQTWRRKLMEL